MPITPERPIVAVVGPCGSGKTTLVNGLRPFGLDVRHVAQEHSYVADMWRRLVHPDILIFLDASYAETMRRRQLNWTTEEYQEQHHRLRDARANADLYILTDHFTPDQLIEIVLAWMRERGVISS
jgi:guanylate kinase